MDNCDLLAKLQISYVLFHPFLYSSVGVAFRIVTTNVPSGFRTSVPEIRTQAFLTPLLCQALTSFLGK